MPNSFRKYTKEIIERGKHTILLTCQLFLATCTSSREFWDALYSLELTYFRITYWWRYFSIIISFRETRGKPEDIRIRETIWNNRYSIVLIYRHSLLFNLHRLLQLLLTQNIHLYYIYKYINMGYIIYWE